MGAWYAHEYFEPEIWSARKVGISVFKRTEAKRTLKAGERIRRDDLHTTFDLVPQEKVFLIERDAVGKRVKRLIHPGDKISRDLVY